MKQKQTNEVDLRAAIAQIQVHLELIDQKIDTLISKSPQMTKIPQKPQNLNPLQANKPIQNPQHNHQSNQRPLYTAICADCKKECQIPFRPKGDRPVYCQDCFSRRKVISLSKTGLEPSLHEAPASVVQAPIIKEVKKETSKPKKVKVVAAKKPTAKKSTLKKKKK